MFSDDMNNKWKIQLPENGAIQYTVFAMMLLFWGVLSFTLKLAQNSIWYEWRFSINYNQRSTKPFGSHIWGGHLALIYIFCSFCIWSIYLLFHSIVLHYSKTLFYGSFVDIFWVYIRQSNSSIIADSSANLFEIYWGLFFGHKLRHPRQ